MILILYIFGLYLQNKSIILFNYKSNYNNETSLMINNIPYRETSIPNNFNGITAFELNSGYYNFNLKHRETDLHWQIFPNWQKIMSTQHKLNDIIVDNTTLVSYKYYSDKSHILHMAYQIVLPQQNNTIKFIINIDGIITTINSNNGLSIYKNISLLEGLHYINIYSKSHVRWCSCPSIKNGFSNGRYFYAWIEPIGSQLELFTKKIKSVLNINLLYVHIVRLMIK